jgi:hypothetical protein
MPGLYAPSEVQSSHTIKRVGRDSKDLTVDLNLAVMIRSLNDNIQDLAYREAIHDTWRILKRPEIKAALDGVFGEEAWGQMKIWIRNLTRGGTSISEMRAFDKKARFLRNGASVSAMGAKVSVMALQFTGISQSAQTLGWGWTLQGIKDVYGSSWGDIKKTVDEMYAKSPQLASRNQKPFDRDMYDSVIKGEDPLFKTWFKKWKEGLFKWCGMLDQMVANAVWMGAYQKAMHEGQSDADAARDADAIISLTQAMGDNKDMSFAQHVSARGPMREVRFREAKLLKGWSWGEAGKALGMFQTFFSSTTNLAWLAHRQAMRDKRAGRYGKMATGLLRADWNLFILPAVFSSLMWGGPDWPDDEDEVEELAKRFARDVIGNAAGGLPIIRDLVGLAADAAFGTGEPRYAVSPIEGSVTGGYRAATALGKLFTEDDDKLKYAARTIRGVGPLVPGLPASQLATTLEGINDWDDNEGVDKLYRLLIRDPNPKK